MTARLLLALACLIAASILPSNAASLEGKRPNILFLLTDDQGYGDISAHGNPVLKTPHLDKLRSESLRFTDFHVSPTCAPTRSALLTGRHEFKNGITHTILERERMNPASITLAEVLKAAGYSTGIFGKWHLGDEPAYQPNQRGFTEVFIHGGGGIGQIYPGSCGDAPANSYFNPTLLHNGTFEKTTGYCTDVFYEKATHWIESQVKAEKPFFAYIPTNAPHGPYHARPEDKALYANKDLSEDTQSFFGMIHNIDQNVGRILKKIEDWGITKNTLVIFMNDNGGTAGVRVFNADMRGAKGTPWIGATRANSFWRWPGTIAPADCTALTAHLDFFPTLAQICGAPLPEKAKSQIEGRSLVSLLENPAAPWQDRTLFTHVGRWPKLADPNLHKFQATSVRNTKWALVSEKEADQPAWQLFDVAKDYAQRDDVAAHHPEVVAELSKAFNRWWDECLPLMVNEKVMGPDINPFQEMYYRQFGGSPTPDDIQKMKSENALRLGQRPRKPAAK